MNRPDGVVCMQVLVSKTLDQASAQFAASALVTTDQLLAFKSKEELVVTSGLNGVLTGAGQWVFLDFYIHISDYTFLISIIEVIKVVHVLI